MPYLMDLERGQVVEGCQTRITFVTATCACTVTVGR